MIINKICMFGDDVETSICSNCGYMPGAFMPGLTCPECGEIFFP